MQQRRGTASQWTTANPILNAGEIGWESDSNKFKIGDGTNTWSNLDYFIDENSLDTTLGDYVETADLGVANGVATLDANSKLTSSQLPDVAQVTVHAVANQAARLQLNVEIGDIAIQSDNGQTYVLAALPASTNANWSAITVSDPFPTHTTSDLAEGTNLYYTEERVQDEINDTVVAGTGVSKNYNDGAGSLTLSIGQAVGTTDNVTFGTVTGNLTGNVTGNVSGNVTGNLTGNVTGNVTGDLTGNVTGSVSGNAGTVTNGVYTTGSTMTGFLTLHADPTQALHAATKQYVDAVSEGLHVHPSVVAATTANINLSTDVENGDVLDGVTLATGNRILVKNQTTQSENGIYVVAASGAPSRAADFDSPAEIDGGDFIFVTGGTTQDNTGWVQTNTVGTIGTDPIAFSQFSGSGTYSAGTGLSLNGTTFSIDTGTTVDLSTAQTLTNKTLTSPVIGTISNTGTLTLPTSTDTLVGRATTDTLTNKSVSLGSNTLTGTLAQFNSALTDADFVSLTGTETLTNKTLTSPTITTPTLTLSTSSSTTEGVIAWDATLDKILVGDGSTAREFASSTLKTNSQTASYTLVLADKDKVVEMNVGSANNLTVPLNSSVAYPVGTQINIVQAGAGQTTVVATAGVTINATPGLKTRAQWSSATLIKRAENTWVLIGDLAS
jgi:hypothetical protein